MPRIVTVQELLAMPKGTVFAELDDNGNPYGLCRFNGPHPHNAEHGGVEFYENSLVAYDGGDAPHLNLDSGRHGLHDPDEKFLVYAPEEVALIVKLMTDPEYYAP